MTTTTITDLKRIDHVIDRSSGRPQSEYWGYYEDQLIGVRSNHHECETMLDEHALNALDLDLDSRPIPRCFDCGAVLGDLGFCETCSDNEAVAHKPSLEERFWSKVNRTDTCWLWTACVDKDGYGMIRVDRKNKRAHRLAYELTIGPIPDGMVVCHRCDTPTCVRPGHLFLGTDRDNMDDCISKGRTKLMGASGDANGLRKHPDRNPHHINPELSRGENNGNAKITQQQADEIRNRYASGGVTQKEIGTEYNISPSQVRNIVHGKSWNYNTTDQDYKDCADRADAAPTPLNIDDTQLAAAWRAYKAGALLWTDVQAIQAGLMPRCADHDRPAAVLLNKRPACPQCMNETEPVAA